MGNPSKWEWSTDKQTAAQLLAEDSLSIPQIAQQLGTSDSTVDRWKKVPEFQARIQENIAAFRAKLLECGLARKERRLAALTDVYHRQQLIVSARGASAEMKSVAGGATGLVTVTWKQFGAGEERQLIPEYHADTALSAEMRAILKRGDVIFCVDYERHVFSFGRRVGGDMNHSGGGRKQVNSAGLTEKMRILSSRYHRI